MKRTSAIALVIFMILAVSIVFFIPTPAEGTVATVRVGPQDVKEVIYKVSIRTVTVELQAEINGVSRMAFVEYGKLEALQLIELLTSGRILVASVDPDRGYVFDYGFMGKTD